MYLKVLAIMIAVMIDRWVQYIPGGQYILRWRTTNWLNYYTTKIMVLLTNYGVTQGYLVIVLLFLPLVLILLLLKLILVLLFGGIGNLLFVTVPLLYFIGNREIEPGDSEFVVAHERSFGILFWFALLGPYGALMYWYFVAMQRTAIAEQPNAESLAALNMLHAIAAWIPARITGFVYVLVGNFTAGFNCWMARMRTPSMQSSQFLADCGNAAVDASIAEDGKNLVVRAFIAWVVLSILIVVFK
jgi:AmpE protein